MQLIFIAISVGFSEGVNARMCTSKGDFGKRPALMAIILTPLAPFSANPGPSWGGNRSFPALDGLDVVEFQSNTLPTYLS